MRSSHLVLDQVDVAFDDERLVANAGLLLPATLADRLGIEQAADELIDLGERPGAARPGRKVLTVVHSLLAGGDSIDDVEALRTGATASVLGHQVMAASTVGTFLRAFTLGHVRQLDRLAGPARSAHPVGATVDAAPARPLAVGALVHHGPRAAALHSRSRRLTTTLTSRTHPATVAGRQPVRTRRSTGRPSRRHLRHDTHRRRTTTAAPVLRLPTQGGSQPTVTNPRSVDPG
jgi:hypothetical protein